MDLLKRILSITVREVRVMRHNPMYFVCIVVIPIIVTSFFTTLMDEGQPNKMPIGIVDLDNSSTTRKLIRTLDSFQSSKVVARYSSVEDARHAIQMGEIYAFMYFPKNTTNDLLASRQPKISFYYSNTSLTAGALIFKDMKTMATLGSAAVGQSTLSAKGVRPELITPLLQPIAIDLHMIGNPWVNYNIYLSTMVVPGCFLLIVLLLTAYSWGSELKFSSSKELMHIAGDNVFVAVVGKMLPYTILFLAVMYSIMVYIFGILQFPAPGGIGRMLLLGLLSVIGAQGFGLTIFSAIPSMRMSMSVCSLWGVLSFSMVGSAYPVFAMDSPLQTLAWLFPLRHYYIIYQRCVFNTFPLTDAFWHIAVLIVFAFMPLLFTKHLATALRTYKYMK